MVNGLSTTIVEELHHQSTGGGLSEAADVDSMLSLPEAFLPQANIKLLAKDDYLAQGAQIVGSVSVLKEKQPGTRYHNADRRPPGVNNNTLALHIFHECLNGDESEVVFVGGTDHHLELLLRQPEDVNGDLAWALPDAGKELNHLIDLVQGDVKAHGTCYRIKGCLVLHNGQPDSLDSGEGRHVLFGLEASDEDSPPADQAPAIINLLKLLIIRQARARADLPFLLLILNGAAEALALSMLGVVHGLDRVMGSGAGEK